MMKRRLDNKGFTLIEVIVSIAILSIVSVVVLRLFILAHDINEKSREIDVAGMYAANMIEQCKVADLSAFQPQLLGLETVEDSEQQFVGAIYYNALWQPSKEGSEITPYRLELILNKGMNGDRNLYEIQVVVTRLEDTTKTVPSEPLIDYTTQHYLVKGD